MKVNTIKIDKKHNSKLELEKLQIIIDFDTSNPDNKVDGDALYYLVCGLDKLMNYNDNKEYIEKVQAISRLDAAKVKIGEILKCLEK